MVASEVKELANQTAKATEEIRTQIAGMQGATTAAVAAIRDIGVRIGEINTASTAGPRLRTRSERWPNWLPPARSGTSAFPRSA